MSHIPVKLVRTVFLPNGSPPVGTVNRITADLVRADIHGAEGQLYCMGELDILIDYTAFSSADGRHLFSYDSSDRGEKPWQAFISLPFAFSEELTQDFCGVPHAELGDIKWFMVASRALEMEVNILIESEELNTDRKFAGEKKNENGCEWGKDGEEQLEYADMMNKGVEDNEEIFAQDTLETLSQSAESSEDMPCEKNDGKQEEEAAEQYDAGSEQDKIASDARAECEPDNVIREEKNSASAESSPEIVRIVFRDEALPDDVEIARAIAAAQAEKEAESSAAEIDAGIKEFSAKRDEMPEATANYKEEAVILTEVDNGSEAEEAVVSPAEVIIPPARKKRRSHGLPHLTVDAHNNKVEISAFNINIKLP